MYRISYLLIKQSLAFISTSDSAFSIKLEILENILKIVEKYLFIVVKPTRCIMYAFNHLLSLQFGDIKYIYILVRPSPPSVSRTFFVFHN